MKKEPISDAAISNEFGAVIWAAQQAFRSDASYLAEMITAADNIERLRKIHRDLVAERRQLGAEKPEIPIPGA